jgi:hypothetical protein
MKWITREHVKVDRVASGWRAAEGGARRREEGGAEGRHNPDEYARPTLDGRRLPNVLGQGVRKGVR